MRNRRIYRITAAMICITFLFSYTVDICSAKLIDRTISLAQAQRMAISTSSDITKKNNQLILKRMKYVEAVKGIKAKVKNLRSFRWSPLLSFKFPEQLTLSEEYELNVKPLTLQTEINNLVHSIKDMENEIIHEVNQLYFDIYYLQEMTAFTQNRLDAAAVQLEKNTSKLKTGDATQTDVDRAQSSVDTLTTSLSNQLRDFENAKKKLSDMVGMDVSVGYKFANGFKTASIPRDALAELIQYTLDNDQAFYETKAAASTALLNLESYEDFMRDEYGSKMDRVQSYINMAKDEMDVDYAAFQLNYNKMLKELDKPWAGKMRILFFSFTMEWFKGEIDGTRYIEDEMYAVYTACMEYANAKREQTMMEKQLKTQVSDTYETLVTGWNSYQSLQKQVELSEKVLEKTKTLNTLGKATYQEVADEQEAYQDAQISALDSLKEYNNTLSEFDRLTCGAVTKYLRDAGMGLLTGESGDAYALLDPINDPYYYIYTSVADLIFFVGISIPDNFEPGIDSFEIWYDGTQIGKRTPVGQEISHLALDYKDTGKLLIRLYNGDEYVDECEIDASVPRDVIEIEGEQVPDPTRVIGTYKLSTKMEGGVSVSELKIDVNAAEGVELYTLTYGDKKVYTTEPRPVKEAFSYLTILAASLDNVVLTLYDRNENEMYDARFDTQTGELITDNNEN